MRACVRAYSTYTRKAAYLAAGTVDCGRSNTRKSAPTIQLPTTTPTLPARIHARENAPTFAPFGRFKVTFEHVAYFRELK